MTCSMPCLSAVLMWRLIPKDGPPDGYRFTGTLLQIGAPLLRARLPGGR